MRVITSTRRSSWRASRAKPSTVSRTACPFGERVMTLPSGLAAKGKMDRCGIRAVHQPDARHQLQTPDEATACVPGEKARRDFDQVDQREADEDQRHRDVAGAEE